MIAHYDFPKTTPGMQVKRLTFNPKDNNQVCTSGNMHWKMWRVQEGTFKPVPAFQKVSQNHNYTDHIWLDDEKMAATTAEGEVFIESPETK